MTISIDKISKASPQEWDEIWSACEYATYFHSREWAEIWRTYTCGQIRPAASMIYFSDGKKALLPLSCQKTGRWPRRKYMYLSSPAGTFGGWLSNDNIEAGHARLLGSYLAEELGSLTWRFNPYDKLAIEAGVTPTKEDETHAIELTAGFDAIFRGWTKGHRSASKKARTEGVEIRCANSPEDWDAYFVAYEDSLQRWGNKASSRYEKSLFDSMQSRHSPNISLWLAIYKDQVIAGSLCFYSKRHVVYWHGAALEEYFKLRPANLLIYEIVRGACEQNYLWFDFNPSGGHEGVKSFKKSFGAQPLACPVFAK